VFLDPYGVPAPLVLSEVVAAAGRDSNACLQNMRRRKRVLGSRKVLRSTGR